MKKSVEERLPRYAAMTHPTNGETILIRRGHKGFYPYHASANETAEKYNDFHGVTPAQVRAMEFGSMFGFNAPGVEAELNR